MLALVTAGSIVIAIQRLKVLSARVSD